VTRYISTASNMKTPNSSAVGLPFRVALFSGVPPALLNRLLVSDDDVLRSGCQHVKIGYDELDTMGDLLQHIHSEFKTCSNTGIGHWHGSKGLY
jgi:hypothetical protein